MFKESPESRCEAVWTSWGSIQAVQDGEGDLYDPDVHILSMDSNGLNVLWIYVDLFSWHRSLFKDVQGNSWICLGQTLRWILDDFVTILC